MPISNFYYDGIYNNPEISNLFVTDTFAHTIQFQSILDDSNKLYSFLKTWSWQTNGAGMQTFMDKFSYVFFDQCFWFKFYPALAHRFPTAGINAHNMEKLTYIKDQVAKIVGAPTLALKNLASVKGELMKVANSAFEFGSKF